MYKLWNLYLLKMNIGAQEHLETMIGTIHKIFLDAKNKGIIRNKELSLLDIIYNILKTDCFEEIENNKKRALLSLYFRILNKYSFLCKSELSRSYYLYNNLQKTFINTNPNTAPVIDDPDPYEPPSVLPPTNCDNGATIVGRFTKIVLTNELFSKCFVDPNEGTIKNIKITSLPTKGILSYNGQNIILNQVIDLTLGGLLLYTSMVDIPGLDYDPFTVQSSGSNYPNLYSDNFTITITIV